MTKPQTAHCRDCNRRLLTKDMHQDGTGSWFCDPCYRAAVELLSALQGAGQKESSDESRETA